LTPAATWPEYPAVCPIRICAWLVQISVASAALAQSLVH